MFFQDLTPYENLKGRPLAIDVGWLDAAHPFPCGCVPDGFAARLRMLARKPVNQTRGFHVCQFCDFGPPIPPGDQAALDARYRQWRDSGALSSAEIRVVAKDGRVYAAPVLISHYVDAHSYQPPQEFVAAVMEIESI
jgi:hypothetical protein